MSFTHALYEDDDVLAVDAPVRNVIHESPDQMNTQAADRPALDVARDIGRRACERIELDTIVPHDCAELLLVGGHLHFDKVLVVVSKSIADDIGEQLIESDGNCSMNLGRERETGTEFVQPAQAPIDLAEVILEPQLDTGSLAPCVRCPKARSNEGA